jgi:plasmid stabilization system protein ParE
VSLKIAPQALRDIRMADGWWKANRPSAPDMLSVELEDALRLLSAQPLAGVALAHPQYGRIRRLYLRGTRYLLYYSVQGEDVRVLRLWHTSRGAKPKF